MVNELTHLSFSGVIAARWKTAILFCCLVGLATSGCVVSRPFAARRWSTPPPIILKQGKTYSAIVHTNRGDITIKLLAGKAPRTVNNFVFLAQQHFFDGDAFFRIIKEFMIQTGDPNNNGTGNPGYSFADELPPAYQYAPGVVAMANAGPNTNGSQFFICSGKDAASLNDAPHYTVFGIVTTGLDVVKRIAATPVVANPNMGGELSQPTQDAHIISVDIVVE